MVAATLSAFVLVGVLSTFLFLGRSGANIQNYNDMEAQSRRALEIFAEDTRQASSITWNSSTNLTLTVNGVAIVYSYDASARSFFRQAGGGAAQAIVTQILSFQFSAYSITGTTLPIGTATELAAATKSTKQLQVSLEAARSSQTVASASNTVLSARFILRNKRVTA